MLFGFAGTALASTVAECTETYDTPALIEAVDSAFGGFGSMDEAGFAASRAVVLRRMYCNTDTFDLPTIGAIHRIEAMNAFLAGDINRTAQALAGMLHTDPGYQFPVQVVPEGHQLRQQLGPAGRLLRDPGTRLLGQPKEGWIELDAEHAKVASTARASVGQRRDAQGAVVETRYLWPEEDLGNWGVAALSIAEAKPMPAASARPAAAPEPVTRPKRESGGPKVPLLVATGVAAGLAGGLYAYSFYTRTEFESEQRYDEATLRAMRTVTNGSAIGSAACGVAAIGLGIGVVATW